MLSRVITLVLVAIAVSAIASAQDSHKSGEAFRDCRGLFGILESHQRVAAVVVDDPQSTLTPDHRLTTTTALLRQQLPVKEIGGLGVGQRRVGLGDSAGVAVALSRILVIVLAPAKEHPGIVQE